MDKILDEFLEEQHNRLQPRTYRDYEEVISLFQVYLNNYAYQFLEEREQKQWEEKVEEDEDCYTKMFGQDKLSPWIISDFLEYFVIRKVMSGEAFIKMAIRVMKKLAKWLYESNYIDQHTYTEFNDHFEEAKELPDLEKLAELLYQQSKKSPDKNFDDFLEGNFLVSDVIERELWLDEELGDEMNIGPVLVSKQISDLCQEGWNINLVIGWNKEKDKWYILESGRVYSF